MLRVKKRVALDKADSIRIYIELASKRASYSIDNSLKKTRQQKPFFEAIRFVTPPNFLIRLVTNC